jgi:hypothetical protein
LGHRGGAFFEGEATYVKLLELLQQKNEDDLRRIFENKGVEMVGQPRRPTRLPMGRIQLIFKDKMYFIEI